MQIERTLGGWKITEVIAGNPVTETYMGERVLFDCPCCGELNALHMDDLPVGVSVDTDSDAKRVEDIGQQASPVMIEWVEEDDDDDEQDTDD